jgi:hypothetical protein
MPEEKKADIWGKLERIDRRILYWILAAIIVFSLLFPIGLPLKVSPRTKNFYQVLQKLPDGSVIAFSIDATVETWPENGPGAVAIAKYIASRHFKTIIWGFLPDASLLGEKYVIPVFKEAGSKYGEDYAFLGFFPGGETTVARLATDIQGVIKKDFYGTLIEQLPMMKDIRSAKDIALVIDIDGTNGTEFYVRHWRPAGVAVISTVVGVIISGYLPFLESGQLSGMLMGIKGNAEFEKLTERLGKGMSAMDMLSLAQTALIILIIIGNITLIRRWLGRRG